MTPGLFVNFRREIAALLASSSKQTTHRIYGAISAQIYVAKARQGQIMRDFTQDRQHPPTNPETGGFYYEQQVLLVIIRQGQSKFRRVLSSNIEEALSGRATFGLCQIIQ